MFYTQYLKEICELYFDEQNCKKHLENYDLDNELYKVLMLSKEMDSLFSLLSTTDSSLMPSLNTAIANLKEQENNILCFYVKWFEEHSVMGSVEASQHPDAIVILGSAQKSSLDKRIETTITYLQKYPSSLAVLSGGGVWAKETESDYMYKALLKAGIKNVIIQEPVSMDTLGNALFTKLTLKRKKLLSSIKNLLIVTSQFHSARALYYFDTIYNENYHIAVKGVVTSSENHRVSLAEHELLTENQAKRTIDIFKKNPTCPLDDKAILLRLFQNHTLYMNRYDIVREYLPYC